MIGRRVGAVPVSADPTAHALVDERASTPHSTLSKGVAFGLAVTVQVAAPAGEAISKSVIAMAAIPDRR
jgi:hypothetical protein